MKDMDSSTWQRTGSSIVWSPDLLAPLITKGEAVPVRVATGWLQQGFPTEPPGGGSTILIGGLQTVVESLATTSSPNDAYDWLRNHVLPLVRAAQVQWDRVGLVFGVDGPGKMFHLNEADDLVYFGKARQREANVAISRALWNGAATGEGAYRLVVQGGKEVGGYHVRRVS